MMKRVRASLCSDVQRCEHQFGAQVIGHGPAHHAAAEHVEHHGEVHEPGRGRDVGDVSHPQPVRVVGVEATLDGVRRRGAPSGHDAWCVAPCGGSPRSAQPRASPEPPACGSPACPQRPAPRECAVPRTSYGCAGESRAHARSAPRQSVLVRGVHDGATRSTRSGRHRALGPWGRCGIRLR